MSVKSDAMGVVQREGRVGTKVFNTLLLHRFHIQAANWAELFHKLVSWKERVHPPQICPDCLI